MPNLGPMEIIIIAGVIILLFGARKMPQMARSLGQSMRILKAETKGMRSEDDTDPAAPATPAKPQAQLPETQPQKPETAAKVDAHVEQPQANKNAS